MNILLRERWEQIVSNVPATNVLASDIQDFECEFGESLIDSNEWHENSWTLLGFAFGNPKWYPFAIELDMEKDYTYCHMVHELFDGDTGLENEFFADLMNAIPAYRKRFCDNLLELLNDD
ncbi:hypothetical protein DIREPILLOW8_84 [Vibrio phage Direpillow8]|uniref:Uncharacterized protein n=3 Tax=Thalassavirus TaxID=2948922 RepID=A0A6M4ES63_9CAUD|nr:hypothetical protein KNU87_gp079 [Vibrio phage Bennett]YP_010105867.1 hypothetical protein KNU88_gp081 [Vibrio phage Chester]YP_010108509.1 hypothetical protein KNV08_gp081 [Vibrio phage Quinn]QIG66203.1 hypothetical protein CILSICK_82 [Vibrio phage Cilsick]QKE60940.1 hypothetical protein DAX_79 [Vibrio phage Dax]QKN84548.1 hypothetical protein BBMUFFIN_82 [Vibrio phage BBMuffin]QKN85523.1 hypothetical protein DIREPILLOW8_84 [Vibrio phage Direpillow8]WBU76887.1 hypothetical protein KRONOS